MIELRKRHWMIAVASAVALHLGVGALAPSSPRVLSRADGAGGSVTVALKLTPPSLPTEPAEAAPAPAGSAPGANPEAPDAPTPQPPAITPRADAQAQVRARRQSQATPAPAPRPEPIDPRAQAQSKRPDTRPEPSVAVASAPLGGAPSASTMAEVSAAGQALAGAERAGEDRRSAVARAGAETDQLRDDYFARLQAYLEQHRRYPRGAKLRRQQGTAVLFFVIDRQGNVLEHRLERSSGHRLLDREVAAMLERAQPLPPAPEELRRSRFELLLPIRFAMR